MEHFRMLSLTEWLGSTQSHLRDEAKNKRVSEKLILERLVELAGVPQIREIVLKFDKPVLDLFQEEYSEFLPLLEYEAWTRFKGSKNYYTYDSQKTQVKTQAHFHICKGQNRNAEIYAVNMDGTAHHKKHRGHSVPNAEAEELRDKGVKIPVNNILEWLVPNVNSLSFDEQGNGYYFLKS